MQISRKNLTNLDLYPFASVACDSNGLVIYKNELTRKLYKSIHIGAKISTYTDASLDSSHIESTSFYGENGTVFVCNLEDEDGTYTVLTIFSVGFCCSELYQNEVSELISAVTALLSQEDSNTSNGKRSLLREIIKKQVLAKKCGAFASSYIENQNLYTYNTASATDLISRIIYIINNRLGLDVKLELCDLCEQTPYIKINKSTILVLLNFTNFAILNTNKNVRVAISNTDTRVNVSFEFCSKNIFENIFSNNITAYYTFMLLTGIDTAERNSIRISFSNNDNHSSVTADFPLIVQRDITFKSNNYLDEMIEEYIKFSNQFFKE